MTAISLVAASTLGELAVNGIHVGASLAEMAQEFLWTGLTAKLMIVTILWPVLASLPTLGVRLQSSGRVSTALLVVAAMMLLAYDLLVPDEMGDQLFAVSWIYPSQPDLNPLMMLPGISALLAFVVASLWLGLLVAGPRGGVAAVVVAFPGLLMAVFLTKTLWFWDVPASIGAAILAAPLGWVAGVSTRRWFQALRGVDLTGESLWAGFAGVGAAILLVQPPSETESPSASWLATLPADAFVHLWAFMAIGSMIAWLHSSDLQSERLPTEFRVTAVAVFLSVVAWRANDHWIATLIELVLACALSMYWFFASRSIRWPSPRAARMLDTAIAELRITNELWRVRRTVQKVASEKLGKLEIKAQDLLGQTQELDELIKSREARGLHARGNAALALNRGSNAAPSQRGRHGALVATIVSLPWISSYIYNLSRTSQPTMPATAVAQYASVVADLFTWPLLGFLFMYFYPYLRGRNGIQKGLVVASTFLLPAVMGDIAGGSLHQKEWAGLVFWSLQVFICCMVIGVCLGDLAAFRLASRPWRHLVDVYNFGTLAAWFSTLTLAAAGAIGAALAGGAGQLVGETIKQILVPASSSQ